MSNTSKNDPIKSFSIYANWTRIPLFIIKSRDTM